MYTKQITYENLDGEMVTEEHQFNLTKAEAIEMNFTRKGGMEEYINRIMQAEEHGELIAIFKDLIRKTYGVREGQRFIKTEADWQAFEDTGAYSAMFIELATNAKSAIEFFRGIFPKDMQAQVDEVVAEQQREYSDDELLSMSWDDFYKAAGSKDDRNWDKRFLMLAFRRKSNPALAGA